MITSSGLSYHEYQVILRNDLATFMERSFCELNPQATFIVPGGICLKHYHGHYHDGGE